MNLFVNRAISEGTKQMWMKGAAIAGRVATATLAGVGMIALGRMATARYEVEEEESTPTPRKRKRPTSRTGAVKTRKRKKP